MKFLLLTSILWFGGISCLVNTNTAATKRHVLLADREHFFEKLCGDSASYRNWKKQQKYRRTALGEENYRLRANREYQNQKLVKSYYSPIQQINAYTRSLSGLFDGKLISDGAVDKISFGGALHRWDGFDGVPIRRHSLLLNEAAVDWLQLKRRFFQNYKICKGFENGFPVFVFHDDQELAEDSALYRKRSRSLHLIGGDDGTMTAIIARIEDRRDCGESLTCYDNIEIYRFDKKAKLIDSITKGVTMEMKK